MWITRAERQKQLSVISIQLNTECHQRTESWGREDGYFCSGCNVNSTGQSSEPCAIPRTSNCSENAAPCNETVWVLLNRYDLNHQSRIPAMPCLFCSMWGRIVWPIISNAADISSHSSCVTTWAARTKLCWRERGCSPSRETMLMVEVFKSIHHLSPKFMRDMFQPKSTPYELRAKNTLQIPPSRTVKYGQRTLSAHEAVLWNSLPSSARACNDLNTFKTLLERWNWTYCLVPGCCCW